MGSQWTQATPKFYDLMTNLLLLPQIKRSRCALHRNFHPYHLFTIATLVHRSCLLYFDDLMEFEWQKMNLISKIDTHFQKKEFWFCKRSIEMSMEMPIDVKLVANEIIYDAGSWQFCLFTFLLVARNIHKWFNEKFRIYFTISVFCSTNATIYFYIFNSILFIHHFPIFI